MLSELKEVKHQKIEKKWLSASVSKALKGLTTKIYSILC